MVVEIGGGVGLLGGEESRKAEALDQGLWDLWGEALSSRLSSQSEIFLLPVWPRGCLGGGK